MGSFVSQLPTIAEIWHSEVSHYRHFSTLYKNIGKWGKKSLKNLSPFHKMTLECWKLSLCILRGLSKNVVWEFLKIWIFCHFMASENLKKSIFKDHSVKGRQIFKVKFGLFLTILSYKSARSGQLSRIISWQPLEIVKQTSPFWRLENQGCSMWKPKKIKKMTLDTPWMSAHTSDHSFLISFWLGRSHNRRQEKTTQPKLT